MPDLSTDQPLFIFHQGSAPLLISFPHVGTHLPPALAARLTPKARQVWDTDWHLPRLYDFAQALGASTLVATHSRYVIDLNRPPDGSSLYPGQQTTGLCPTEDFDGESIYLDPADAPDDAEVVARRDRFWQPYHDQLAAELARLRAQHGAVALWDAHSIHSVLPRFFEGKLPDLNLGTGQGSSCDAALAERVLQIAQAVPGLTAVLNGRYTGGYITRHYGRPAEGVTAMQLEMTQCSYMQEAMPFDYLPEVATHVHPHVRAMVETLRDHARQQGRARG